MATTETAPAAPVKRRKPQGPRQTKPVFAVVTYEGEDGASIRLDKSKLKIVLERDAAKLVDLVTSDDMSSAAVIRVEMPATATRKPATE